jgi:DNA-binding XRE family transcriptional regulator
MASRTTLYAIPQLAEIRIARFITQGELSRLAKVSRAAISAIEAGGKANPETVRKLAEALGMTREELIAPKGKDAAND